MTFCAHLFTVITVNILRFIFDHVHYYYAPRPAHTPTYCNTRFLRWRAWLSNEILLFVVYQVRIYLEIMIFRTRCCLHFTWFNINNWYINYLYYYPPPLPTHLPTVTQGFCADAHGLTMNEYMVVGVVVRTFLMLMIFCTCCSQFTLVDIFILPPPLRTHPTTVIQDFCADAHGLTRMLVGGVVRTH